jgi:hypothetical protein
MCCVDSYSLASPLQQVSPMRELSFIDPSPYILCPYFHTTGGRV